jgi:NAD kinase
LKGNIVFFSNPENTASNSVLKDTMDISLSNGYHCIALSTNCLQDMELPDALSFIVAIGGDGTILKAVPLAEHYSLPILGINLGRVGFLSEILPEDYSNALHQFETGSLFLDERMMLACAVNGQHKGN